MKRDLKGNARAAGKPGIRNADNLRAVAVGPSPEAERAWKRAELIIPLRMAVRHTLGPRHDAFHALLADAREILAPILAGKSVAVVGNAQSLIDHTPPHNIDDHDVVVRIKRGPFVAERVGTLGRRTDILLVTNHMHAVHLDVDIAHLAERPAHLVFTRPNAHKFGRRLAKKYAFYPPRWYAELREAFQANPSTGACGIDLVTRLVGERGEAHLYGFDFFATPSNHKVVQQFVGHNSDAERTFALARVGEARYHRPTQATPGSHTTIDRSSDT